MRTLSGPLSIIFVLCIALVVGVAVPAPQGAHITVLYPRAINPTFTFTGDLKSFDRPPTPPPPSPNASKKAKDAAKKKAENAKKKYEHQQAEREQKQKDAGAAVKAALNDAQSQLGLSDGNLAVTVLNGFHSSKDKNDHVTFRFKGPKCSASDCLGHAYANAGHGKIWDGQGKLLWEKP